MNDCIKDYNGDLLWLFKHIPNESERINNTNGSAVFGVYTGIRPQDDGHDTTDKDCTLFAVTPKFKILHQDKITNKFCNNYICAKPEDGHIGLGFCRQSKSDKFRVWVGNNFKESYVLRDADDAFGKER